VDPIAAGDRDRAIATIVSAFIRDPVERWLFAEPAQYLTRFPVFVAALGGGAFSRRTGWTLADFAAVALWLPPGAEPDTDAVIGALVDGVDEEQHADTFAVLELMGAAHPTVPHWYLAWLGVDAARSGAGLGGRLLEQCLAVVDDDHLPAFLETSNPRNIPFYERHGFEVTSVAQAGACPPVTSMLRAPSRS
jgi:GNAT superfamily N-acetyltransferase